jgi:hypothetical protein
MVDQHRYEPLESSAFFDDGRSARPPVEGTVPRGGLRLDRHLHTGRVDGQLADTFPFPVTREVLSRGRERFEIFCSPCHDRVGNGIGMAVQRGFRRPPSFHTHRLREIPVGYIFDVITNGFGMMSGYSPQIPVRDRWAVAAYIRALQLSQYAPAGDLTADELRMLPPLGRP